MTQKDLGTRRTYDSYCICVVLSMLLDNKCLWHIMIIKFVFLNLGKYDEENVAFGGINKGKILGTHSIRISSLVPLKMFYTLNELLTKKGWYIKNWRFVESNLIINGSWRRESKDELKWNREKNWKGSIVWYMSQSICTCCNLSFDKCHNLSSITCYNLLFDACWMYRLMSMRIVWWISRVGCDLHYVLWFWRTKMICLWAKKSS